MQKHFIRSSTVFKLHQIFIMHQLPWARKCPNCKKPKWSHETCQPTHAKNRGIKILLLQLQIWLLENYRIRILHYLFQKLRIIACVYNFTSDCFAFVCTRLSMFAFNDDRWWIAFDLVVVLLLFPKLLLVVTSLSGTECIFLFWIVQLRWYSLSEGIKLNYVVFRYFWCLLLSHNWLFS